MSVSNRVLWKEGLFIRPHHFQQESRFFSSQIKQTLETNMFNIGVDTLVFEMQYLAYGKLSLSECKGIMPDGTLFHLPVTDELPAPLLIDSAAIGKIVYLCLPLSINGNMEIANKSNDNSLIVSRSEVLFTEIKDVHSESGDYAQLELIKNHYLLKLENDDLSHYATLPIARIKDVTLENKIVLDEEFYPTAITLKAIPKLLSNLFELTELIRYRAKNLATRIASPEQSGVADVNDFLMLLTFNRVLPLVRALAKNEQSHPFKIYELLASLHSELATFVLDERIPNKFYDYIHETPHLSLEFLYSDIKSYLSVVSSAKALSIPVVASQYGIYIAQVKDSSLYESSEFILAVKAKVQVELLKSQFTQQTKVSSIEQIHQLVHLQLPGIALQALPVAPRYLPYHSGFVYFQLDKTSSYWEYMRSSSGFGFHIAGNYPELEIEFWAIRGANI